MDGFRITTLLYYHNKSWAAQLHELLDLGQGFFFHICGEAKLAT
jgi:hypothetical protein